jgi:L-seryl-tRNA(Ser) seleniumtransferase
MSSRDSLKSLPSVDEVLRSPEGERWLECYPRRYVLDAVRTVIDRRRKLLAEGKEVGVSVNEMAADVEETLRSLSSLSLRPVINATGIVVHTNLGRSPLSESALANVVKVARGYSNLEYDLAEGRRGKRYSHIKRLLREVTGAEDGLAVNNNAGAVLLSLNALARGKEVLVSRGELVEIGGSFRVPDVMAQSGAVLREVGTTNKTHLRDYEEAINENTGLILKVHQSNYRIIGFAQDVSLENLVALGRKHTLPVMYDMGSGCLTDFRSFGLNDEPSVQEVVRKGPDVLTFSGDKLLGGPQAGIIVGTTAAVSALQGNPLLRALRIDKLTLAALEATLMEYIDPERAQEAIPTLRMLFEPGESVRKRARRIAARLKKETSGARIRVIEDVSYSGGGALPEHAIPSYAVSVVPEGVPLMELEERLRNGEPPVIGRIREDTLLLDARTIEEGEIGSLVLRVKEALS